MTDGDRGLSVGFVIGLITGLLVGYGITTLASAESAIVSFNDAEHLVALQDSVINTCDTAWIDGMRLYNPFPRDTSWIQGAVGHGLVTITCRELVYVMKEYPPIHSLWKKDIYGSEVAKMSELETQKIFMWSLGIPGEPPDYGETISGTAIINYRRVTQ